MKTLLLLSLYITTTIASQTQVHLALGRNTDEMSVAWVAEKESRISIVMWGSSPDRLVFNNTGDTRVFTQDPDRTFYTKTAIMNNLRSNQKYYYKVGDPQNGFSSVFSFTHRRTQAPYKHVLFGDMGAADAYTLCKACTANQVCDETTCVRNTSVGLVGEVDSADMFLHVGDFAYNFADLGGKLGDQFMSNIEQIAARVPYMVSHGNHENSAVNLAHFIERFRSQPSNAVPSQFRTANGVTTNTMYFSWDFGLVHYISFSSEFWHRVESQDPVVNKDTFIAWLKDDLEKANRNRHNFPWILTHDHRPFYTSADQFSADPAMARDLEDILFQYGVDFSINGHQHNYERSYPLYHNKSTPSYQNPGATIYIVSGAAGSREMHTPFQFPQPPWCPYRANVFSYTRMYVHNYTHVFFEQVGTDPTTFPLAQYGEVIDSFWVVQNNHGPFSPDRAPKTERKECPECFTRDHFAPLLPDLDDGSGRPLYNLIQDFRAKNGEAAWIARLDKLLSEMNKRDAVGDDIIWEDGNFDEKSRKFLKWADGNQA